MSLAAEALASPDRHHNAPPLRDRLGLDYAGILEEAEKIAAEATAAPKTVASDADLGVLAPIVTAARALRKRADDARRQEKEPFLSAGRDVDAFFAAVTERMERVQAALEQRATEWQRRKAEEARREREAEAARLREEEERKRRVAAAEEERNRQKAAARKTAEADAIADRAAEVQASAAAPAAELTRVRTESGVVATTTTRFAAEITDYEALDLNQLRHHFARADVEKALRAFVKVHRDTKPLSGVRIYADERATFR